LGGGAGADGVRDVASFVGADGLTRLWIARDDPRLWPIIQQVWATAATLAPMRFARGLYRHRSIEAMNAQTERWADERIRRAQARVIERADGSERTVKLRGGRARGR